MVETLITSSALIAGICAFRLLFKGRISPRIMYAMWGLPALRLLMPLFYPADRWLKTLRSSFSVMNAVDRLHEQMIAGTEMEPLVDNILTAGSGDTPIPIRCLRSWWGWTGRWCFWRSG